MFGWGGTMGRRERSRPGALPRRRIRRRPGQFSQALRWRRRGQGPHRHGLAPGAEPSAGRTGRFSSRAVGAREGRNTVFWRGSASLAAAQLPCADHRRGRYRLPKYSREYRGPPLFADAFNQPFCGGCADGSRVHRWGVQSGECCGFALPLLSRAPRAILWSARTCNVLGRPTVALNRYPILSGASDAVARLLW